MSKVYHLMLKDNPDALYKDLKDIKEAMLRDNLVTFYGTEVSFFADDRFVALSKMQDAVGIHTTFALQKDSELLHSSNHYGLKFREAGVISYLKHKYLDHRKPRMPCGRHFQEDSMAMDVKTLLLIVVVPLLGTILSITILAFEVIHKKCTRKLEG